MLVLNIHHKPRSVLSRTGNESCGRHAIGHHLMCLAACGEARLSSLIGRCWSNRSRHIKSATVAHIETLSANQLATLASHICERDVRQMETRERSGIIVAGAGRAGPQLRQAAMHLSHTSQRRRSKRPSMRCTSRIGQLMSSHPSLVAMHLSHTCTDTSTCTMHRPTTCTD